MAVKNKLYKHHRSKFVLTMRNFSIAFGSLFLLAGLIGIPTYISTNNMKQVEAKKVEEKVDVEEEEVLTINEN